MSKALVEQAARIAAALERIADALEARPVKAKPPAPANRQALRAPGNGKPPTACPKCGALMRRRERRADGAPFWGCSTYPACNGIVPIDDGDVDGGGDGDDGWPDYGDDSLPF